LLHIAVGHGNFSDIQTPEWENMRLLLASVSRSRVQRGLTLSEIASFILCFKKRLEDEDSFSVFAEEFLGTNSLYGDRGIQES